MTPIDTPVEFRRIISINQAIISASRCNQQLFKHKQFEHRPGFPAITLPLVSKLVSEQFPEWAHLRISPVELSGIDNRTFQLGEEMSIRLPSAKKYAVQVQKEQKWLPKLAPDLSFRIPKPLGLGQPSKEYPWNWSINHWIEGESGNIRGIDDICLQKIASQLAQFLN